MSPLRIFGPCLVAVLLIATSLACVSGDSEPTFTGDPDALAREARAQMETLDSFSVHQMSTARGTSFRRDVLIVTGSGGRAYTSTGIAVQGDKVLEREGTGWRESSWSRLGIDERAVTDPALYLIDLVGKFELIDEEQDDGKTIVQVRSTVRGHDAVRDVAMPNLHPDIKAQIGTNPQFKTASLDLYISAEDQLVRRAVFQVEFDTGQVDVTVRDEYAFSNFNDPFVFPDGVPMAETISR